MGLLGLCRDTIIDSGVHGVPLYRPSPADFSQLIIAHEHADNFGIFAKRLTVSFYLYDEVLLKKIVRNKNPLFCKFYHFQRNGRGGGEGALDQQNLENSQIQLGTA